MSTERKVRFGEVEDVAKGEAGSSEKVRDEEAENFAPGGMTAKEARELKVKKRVSEAGLDDEDGDVQDYTTRVSGEEHNPHNSLAEVDAGATITAFNMSEELEDGYVEGGNYIANEFDSHVQRALHSSSDEDEPVGNGRKAIPDHVLSKKERRKLMQDAREEEDNWVDDDTDQNQPAYDEKQAPPRKRQRTDPQNSAEDEFEIQKAPRSEAELSAILVQHLKPKENVLSCLRRLGGKENSKNPTLKSKFDEVTEVADELLNGGQYTIYQQTREQLMKLAKTKIGKSLDVGDSVKPKLDLWELKWGEDTETYGPFTAEQMLGWQQSGYFSSERTAYARRQGAGGRFALARDLSYSS
ncbi:hypothetical protein NDN08_002357 [Rhodosorus marinus]|uniref:GYF domain-containing protein n=1 Tax=Rhodosorus marinus TaxID=101924 RepID=A0AAV8UX16_9RHOD|nr:hypothetical protein NDN08_002357 [Rhodosorus marinus]